MPERSELSIEDFVTPDAATIIRATNNHKEEILEAIGTEEDYG